MYSNSYMPSSLINGYKRPLTGWPHSVYLLLSFNMKVLILCLYFFTPVLSEEKPYYIPSDYYDLWTVIGRNSSGQLYFNPTPDSRRVFIWKPHNGSLPPTLFFEDHPQILQDNLPTTSSGIFEETVSQDIHSTSSSTPEKIKETLSTARSPVQPSVDTPATSALELPPKRELKNATTGRPGTNLLQLHENLIRAKLASKLNRQPDAHNLTLPQTRNGTHELPSPSTDKIVYAKDEISLTKEISRLSYFRKAKLRVKRQISPDVATELNLNDAQLNSLQTQVNRKFLVGYDCANPQDVKPISSFIRDPCEPVADDQQDNYEIDETAQYQIVQYETRREFKGTRCERYISQFTYYCGNADHSSPYPQETFYHKPKALHWDQCKELATLGRYIAGDDKTYEVTINTRTEVPYFAFGSATAYTGIAGNQITCSGHTMMIDGKEIYHMVMFVIEEILYREEKFVTSDDEDTVIAHYDNVRLTCPIEDQRCIGGDVSYVWRVPLKEHCPLYHIRTFKGQLVEHQIKALTIQKTKIVMSNDQAHVRFVIKGEKEECGQNFLATNYPDILIRKTVVNGVVDNNLVKRTLPKDELQLSNFITNRDDYVFHAINRKLKREFFSVIRDDCRENLRKMKTEHFLERQLPGLHTYRLGGSNYLTAAGEVAYFYKCRPRLVAAIRADTCYDALPVEIASENVTLTTYFQADGHEATVPKFYIEPLTHRLTSVAKKVPCLSKFFARYQDIFGQWFAVTPSISPTEAPGKLDLETLRKKVSFSDSLDVDLSRGGIYEPEAVDDLITWLEGNRRQEVVMHQITNQVGSLSPGQYITPRLMFPPHTLPGGSWHTFILGKLWGAIRGLGEIFSSIFGLLIVGRLVWYLIKVLMNCSYIHSVHGCSAQLAWSFCTEVFFTRLYRKDQRSTAERSDNDPSDKPNSHIRNRIFNFGNIFSRNVNDNDRAETPSVGIPIPMNPLRRSHSVSHLRKDTVSTCPNRLQAQLDRALAAFQPCPPGMPRSPFPPDYVNDQRVGSPLDGTRTNPSAPIDMSEVARDGIEPPPLPERNTPAARTVRTPNRFAFTPIPDAIPNIPPVPAREPVINRPPSGDPPLPGR